MNFCHNCGEKLTSDSKFCGQCGAKLIDPSDPPKKVDDQVKKAKKPLVEKKSNGRYVYPILGGLVFVLIFGSRALWTAYKDNDQVAIKDTNQKGVRELLLDKNWVLKSFSNLSLTANNDLIDESDLEEQFNQILDDASFYVRFKRAPACKGDRIIQYAQSMDEELGEVGYEIYAAQLSKKKGKTRLYWESNQMRSIGIDSYVDNSWEVESYKEQRMITELDENTLKCKAHVRVESIEGEVWEYDVDVVYRAIEDDTSTMVKANHEITEDWMIVDCERFDITPEIGSDTYNRLEKIDENFDFDLSDAEFDYDEL